ncbi:contractile injection system protein, VgrG/Pvc8 family, partial [Neisseriaceae bacterium TC5R-5]|nr:contractile injection system protein, VgrG/Pvc8 family [Neisseriaceae bacterium TC5R-5]
ARTRMEQLHSAGRRLSAEGAVRGIACGDKFTLQEHPQQDANAEYIVLGSQLILQEIAETSGQSRHYHCHNVLKLHPSDVLYRHPSSQPKPVIKGVQSAVVVTP